MNRAKTGAGYVYYRDRGGDSDATVYEHQLVALLDHDPHRVFRSGVHVHHEGPKDFNHPGHLQVVDRRQHDGADHRGLMA